MKDITGLRFGGWVAIRFSGMRSRPSGDVELWIYKCTCGCGTEREFSARPKGKNGCSPKKGRHLHSGNNKDIRPSPTYSVWKSLTSRCLQPSSPAYAHYKSRGISLCERWRKFDNFLCDMGERPHALTIDRIDNNKGYEPGNCRWATRIEQANNRITNITFEYKGKTLTLANLARETGVSKEMLRSRLCRCTPKWSVEDAVNTPRYKKPPHMT